MRNGIPRTTASVVIDTTSLPVSHDPMKSQLADAVRRSIREDVRRMTAEERLAAFLAHCQLMAQLASAGTISQPQPRETASPRVHRGA
jgi:hypothetical protein